MARGGRAALGRARAHRPLRRPRLVRARHARRHAAGGAASGARRARRALAGAADRRRRPRRSRAARSAPQPRRAALRRGARVRRAAAAGAADPHPRRRRRAAHARDLLGSRRSRPRSSSCRAPPPTSSSSTPGSSTSSTRSSRCTGSRSRRTPAEALAELAAQHRAAQRAVAASRATTAEPHPRGRGATRRRARAVPVGGRALRARGAAHVPRRRAGARQDGRGARRARGRRGVPGRRRLPGVDEADVGARGSPLAASPLAGGAERPRAPSPATGADITILNYEIVQAHLAGARGRRATSAGRRRVPLLQEPAGQAHARRCGGWPRRCRATGCGWR